MLVIFGLIVLVLISTGLSIYFYRTRNPYEDAPAYICAVVAAILGIGLFISGIACLYVQFDGNKAVVRLEEERSIIYSMATEDYTDYEFTGGIVKQEIISRVAKYNKEIKEARIYAYNPWTNWFVSQKVADCELIDVEEIMKIFNEKNLH